MVGTIQQRFEFYRRPFQPVVISGSDRQRRFATSLPAAEELDGVWRSDVFVLSNGSCGRDAAPRSLLPRWRGVQLAPFRRQFPASMVAIHGTEPGWTPISRVDAHRIRPV